MGGSKKQSQRTKGNVKPSSSRKATEMLVKDGKTGFVGFGGLSESMGNAFGYVPKSVGGGGDDELNMDSELRMLMRKMGKKDTITKLKAVQEFSQLCSEKSVEDIVNILSFWPRIYNKLSEDYDHRVREGAQLAQLEVANKVGHKLAPQLKIMIASWMRSQYDQYAPAASLAKTSFNATFPGNKTEDVLSFCKKELLVNIYNLLIKQTKNTVSDPRVTPEEEREAKYNRLISSTLLSFGCIMEVLQKDTIDSVSEQCENIFCEKKFWKFSKHHSPMVRAAFFSVLSSTCQHHAEILQSHSTVFCSSVLCSIDESDPMVVGPFWECLLHTVNQFEECWNHVNARKAVLPKFWSVLRKGGFGCATIIFPNILPFLGKIPKWVIGDAFGFAKELFTNMKEGLSFDKFASSQSESIAVVKAYMECLRFVLFNFSVNEAVGEAQSEGRDEDENEAFVSHFIQEEVGFLIENSIGAKIYPWRTTFLAELRDFISYTEKKANEKSDKNNTYCEAIDALHHLVRSMTVSFLQKTENELGECNIAARKQCKAFDELIKGVIFKTVHSKQKYEICVGFSNNASSEDRQGTNIIKTVEGQCDKIRIAEDHSSDTKKLSLSEWTKDILEVISSNCIELLFSRRCVIFLEFFSDIFSCIDYKSDFEQLISYTLKTRQSLGEQAPQFHMTGNDYNDFIQNIIQPIMSDDFSEREPYWTSTDCQIAVVTLLCRMLTFVDENGQQKFLATVTKISRRPYMFSLLVQKVLSSIGLDSVASWFNDSNIWSQLFRFTSEQFELDDTGAGQNSAFDSILLCIETCLFFHDGYLCFTTAIQALFDIFKNQLTMKETNGCGIVSKRIMSILAKFYSKDYARNMLTDGPVDMLVTIFQFMIKESDNSVFESALVALRSGIYLLHQSTEENHQNHLDNVLQKIACWVQKMCDFATDVNEIHKLACCSGQLISITNSDASEAMLMHYSQRFLSQLTCNLDRYVQSTDFSFETSLLVASIDGTLSVSNLPRVAGMVQTLSRSSLRSALFSVRLFSQMESFPDQEVVIKSIINSFCILCLFTEDRISEDGNDAQGMRDEIELSVREIFEKEEFPLENLMNSALDRALDNGGLKALSLEKLLKVSQKGSRTFPVSDLLGRAMSHGQHDSNSLDGLKLILSNLEDLSISRALVEQYVDQLCNENIESLKDFSRVLELCLTSIIHWHSMLESDENASHDLNQVTRTILTHLIHWVDASQDAFLFSSGLAEVSDEQISFNVNVMKLLSFCLDCGVASKLDKSSWDFILCSLASWIQTCEDNMATLGSSYRDMFFTLWACNLCSSCSKVCHYKIGGESGIFDNSPILVKWKTPWNTRKQMASDNANQISDDVMTEWQEFFAPAIFKSIYSIYTELLDAPASIANTCKSNQTLPSNLLQAVSSALIEMPSTLLLDILLGNKTFEQQLKEGSIPEVTRIESADFSGIDANKIQKMYCIYFEQLKSDVLPLQVVANAFLCKLMLVSHSVALSLTTESVEGDDCHTLRSFPENLMDILRSHQEEILAYLEEHATWFGSYMTQTPSSRLSHCILVFLLSWQIILRLFQDSAPGYRAAYANFFRKQDMIGPLLTVLFSILPHDKGHLLSTEPVAVDGGLLTLGQIRQYSFQSYLAALECIPAIVRSWCNNNLDKRSATVIERFTTAFASPVLCSREIDQVSFSSKTFTNMSIKTRPAAREVVALYSVEEIFMELVVKMSPSHPLGPVSIECGKRVGVSTAQWRKWMLQLTMYLTLQNGTIVDGLALWKRNVDKKFEGVEECMICFSVVHGTNYQLPTISCRVCSKRSHSSCLYKWFSTSNKSTCPLCRSSF